MKQSSIGIGQCLLKILVNFCLNYFKQSSNTSYKHSSKVKVSGERN